MGLSTECEPTVSVLHAEATDLECVKHASRTTLRSSQKLPSNQMARLRVASPVRDVAPPPWYQTTYSTAVPVGPLRRPSDMFPCHWPSDIKCNSSLIMSHTICDKCQAHFHGAVHLTFTKSVDVEGRTT